MITDSELTEVQRTAKAILNETSKKIVGKSELINQIIICLFSEGNILIEGVPGIAKTLIASTFASALGCEFKRIQFTPDLMPGDITGTYIYNQKTGEFELKKGPVFANIILVDEINRASAKSQSALLECMEEKQVSLEGTTLEMKKPFMVIATQNPIEHEGTYSLPESQTDRFMFKLDPGHPDEVEEFAILILKNKIIAGETIQVSTPDKIIAMINHIKKVHVSDKVMQYITNIIISTRNNENILLGASPRASIALLNGSKALAAIRGRSYVIPDDVKYLIPIVLKHRLILTPDSEFSGLTVAEIINNTLLNQVEII